jgi:PAS domain S-box-containing protein
MTNPAASAKLTAQVVAIGRFDFSLTPLRSVLWEATSLLLECPAAANLPGTLGDHHVALTDMAWLATLDEAQRQTLADRIAPAACWIVLTEPGINLSQQVELLRIGVSHFLDKPLLPERVAALVEEWVIDGKARPFRAFLVDDQQTLLNLSTAILVAAGMEVASTKDPARVLDLMDDFHPDVLVMDIEMPLCFGPELVALIRQKERFAHLPVVYLTGSSDRKWQLAARKTAADDFLQKPADPEVLATVVAAQARRHRRLQRMEDDRAREREASNQRLEQLRSAIDQHAAVSMADVSGNITDANDEFCQSTGYRRDELVGQNHRIMQSGQHSSSFYDDMWATLTAGRVWQGEICNRTRSGADCWFATTIMPFLDSFGEPERYIAIRTNITALKQTEDALSLFRRLVESSDQAIGFTDAEGNIQYCNPALQTMLGYPLAESYGKHFEQCLAPEAKTQLPTIIQKVAGGHGWHGQLRMRRKDGSEFVSLSNLGGMLEDDGRLRSIFNIFTDHTEELVNEDMLRHAVLEANAASHAKSEFLSRMSHELRTPMNAIIGFAQLLEVDKGLHADQLDNAQEILKAGRHLLDLINEVLDLAKVESGHVDLSLEPVSCADLIEECSALLRPLANASGITIESSAAAATVVRADRVRLKQVLLNLLSNAVKYNRRDGRVTIRSEAINRASGERIRLHITDTGPGIAAKYLPELFQPFNRLGAEAGEIEGTGIGLVITRRLVDLMGGEIGVASEPGKGSDFWFELPCATLLLAEAPPPAQGDFNPDTAHAAAVPHAVLYIEDNPSNLKLVGQILGRRPGIRLMTAHTAAIGLELATHQPFDLILLDINMPEMDGYEVLAKLQQNKHTRHIPVVAITANATDQDIKRGEAAGFTYYLTKPLDVDHFLAAVDRLLSAGGRHA